MSHRLAAPLGLTLFSLLLLFPVAGSAASSTLELSVNGIPVASPAEEDRAAVRRNLDRVESLLGDELSKQALSGPREFVAMLERLRNPQTRAGDVPRMFRGLQGLSLAQGYWNSYFKRKTRLKGRLLEYVYDRSQHTGWLVFSMRIDWFDTDTPEPRPPGQEVVTERDFLRWFVEIAPDQESGAPGWSELRRRDVSGEPGFTPAPGTPPFKDAAGMEIRGLPRHATNPADQRSVYSRGLTYKLLAMGASIKVRSVYHQKNNDGSLVRLPDIHPFYDPGAGGDAPRCLDIMFRGAPPAFHLPDQLGWCFGMCLDDPDAPDNPIVVINSNGD